MLPAPRSHRRIPRIPAGIKVQKFVAYYLENFKDAHVYFPIRDVLARAGYGLVRAA